MTNLEKIFQGIEKYLKNILKTLTNTEKILMMTKAREKAKKNSFSQNLGFDAEQLLEKIGVFDKLITKSKFWCLEKNKGLRQTFSKI